MKKSAKALLFTAIALLSGIASVAAAADETFSAAVLHGIFSNRYGKNLHHNEFDAPLKQLGWNSQKFASTPEEMAELGKQISKFDAVLIAPLFNFSTPTPDLPAEYAEKLGKFVQDGGALVITDAVYPVSIDWLTAIDPGLKAGLQACDSCIDSTDTTPPNPLQFLPNRLRGQRTWNHLETPGKTKWEVIARCGQHGAPATIAAHLGKGYLYVTSFRQANVQMLENVRANLELQRIGLRMLKFDMPKLTAGTGNVEITLENRTETAITVQAELSLTPSDRDQPPMTFRKPMTLAPRETAELNLPYEIGIRGELNARLVLNSGARNAVLFDRGLTIPDLLRIGPPRYRGFALASDIERTGQTVAIVDIVPYRETIETLTLETRITASNGETVEKPAIHPVPALHFKLPLATGKLPPGEYRIHARLLAAGKMLEQRTTGFRVFKDAECPTFINDEMNLVVGGKPFFPIGIYHVEPGEFGEAGRLGFNTMQLFSWFGAKAVDEAQKHGMKVIWEQNHRTDPQVIRDNAPKLKNHPNLLMWYGMDEPYEPDYETALNMTKNYHDADAGHPTFMVSCRPVFFPEHAEVADVMAVDPYPYPIRPLTTVSEWIDLAWRATRNNKPVIAVLQSFGHEPEPEMRAMAYLALTHEARGVLWYPWDDGKSDQKPNGGIGLKYNPELRQTVKQLCSEINMLAPALLNQEGRRQLRSKNGKIHGLLCREPGENGKRYLLLVNPEKSTNSFDPGELPELEGVRRLQEIFGTGGSVPTRSFPLKPYDTKAFVW